MLFCNDKATTNLHLDIADAVNIMLNVTVPTGVADDYVLSGAFSCFLVLLNSTFLL